MPRISLEEKVKVDEYVTKVKTIVYELPEKIVYNDKVLSYDSYHRAYINGDISIRAIDFLKERLEKQEKVSEDNKRWID